MKEKKKSLTVLFLLCVTMSFMLGFVACGSGDSNLGNGENGRENTQSTLDTAISNFMSPSGGTTSEPAKLDSSVPEEPEFTIIPAEAKTVEYEKYDNGLISMDIPKGWNVEVLSPDYDYVGYGFTVTNPEDDRYELLFYRTMGITYTGPFSDNERAAQYSGNDDIIVNPVTVESFFQSIFKKSNLNFEVVEDLGTTSAGDSGTIRAIVTDGNGKSVEGIFSTTLGTMFIDRIYDIYGMFQYGADLGDYNVVYALGVTEIATPDGELINWADQLIHCLSTITFSDEYMEGYNIQWKQINNTSNIIADTYQDISDTITSGWEARESTYDIISQKQSDATLGYDRVYDTETGEIYKAYNGFTDDISTDNYLRERYKPITDDMYMEGIDGYIEK